MNIVTCRPKKDANWRSLESAFDTCCDFPGFRFTEKEQFSPSVDIYESGEKLILLAEIPGMEKDAIKIIAEDGTLTLSGERRISQAKDKDILKVELKQGKFRRSFRLPDYIDTENISADYKNGILTIELPKQEKAVAREIEVKIR